MATEDEQQHKSLSSSHTLRQLTLERDQALADLSSVERSFADLFRRYENMKGVLEGFKKVGQASNNAYYTVCSVVHNSLIINSFMAAEWGGAKEECTGLPDEDQAGRATVPNPEGARWGETKQVRNMNKTLTSVDQTKETLCPQSRTQV